jgi:hypothetical protein
MCVYPQILPVVHNFLPRLFPFGCAFTGSLRCTENLSVRLRTRNDWRGSPAEGWWFCTVHFAGAFLDFGLGSQPGVPGGRVHARLEAGQIDEDGAGRVLLATPGCWREDALGAGLTR